jgi:hypothetical protein
MPNDSSGSPEFAHGCGFAIALVAKQFAEFAHLASTTVSKEAGTGFVPAVEMAKTNPTAVAAVRADGDRAGF